MWKCLKCDEVGGGDSKICRKCGSILEEVVEETESPPVAEFPEVDQGPEITEAPQLSTDETDAASSSPMGFLRSLAEAEEATDGRQTAGDWPCPKCSETVQGNFDVCWNCGTARDGAEDPEFVRAGAADAVDEVAERDKAPGVPQTVHSEQPAGAADSTGDRCPKCGSDKMIPHVFIADQGQCSDGRLQVVVFGNPEALFLKDRLYGQLEAKICGRCGHVELRVVNPEELYEHYRQSSE